MLMLTSGSTRCLISFSHQASASSPGLPERGNLAPAPRLPAEGASYATERLGAASLQLRNWETLATPRTEDLVDC